jgi:TolA-binding protein
MRQKNYLTLLLMVGCLMLGMMVGPPAPARAADNKDLQAIQRDIADLQEQVKGLQKGFDSKLASLQSMIQQALDTANKTNSTVTNLNSGVSQTMQTELRGVKDQLNSVTGLSVKVDNASNDLSDLHNTVAGLVTTVNREQQQLSDILNQLKLMQAPAVAPPPGVDTGIGPQSAAGPPPDPGKLFTHAASDQDGGKLDLALTEFTEFLHLYPNDPNAIKAQYNIGNIYYSQGKLDSAVTALDAAIEQYPKDQVVTASAYFMKGMALKKARKNADAIASFRHVVTDFPRSEEAPQAKTQLTSMGATATAVAPKRSAH